MSSFSRSLSFRLLLVWAVMDFKGLLLLADADADAAPAGAQQLLLHRDPFDELMGTVAVGLLAGMAAGMAMRSFLLMPLFFC